MRALCEAAQTRSGNLLKLCERLHFKVERFNLDEASGGSREHQEQWEMEAELGAPRLLNIYLFVALQVI